MALSRRGIVMDVSSQKHETGISQREQAPRREVLGRLLTSGGSGRREGKRGAHTKGKTGDFTRGMRGGKRGRFWEKMRFKVGTHVWVTGRKMGPGTRQRTSGRDQA